jgi:hypothetical protein
MAGNLPRDGRLFPQLTGMLVSATAAIPPSTMSGFWDDLGEAGVRARRQPRNKPLGATFTRPDDQFAVVAPAYADRGDGGTHDEDYIVIDLRSGGVEHMPPDAFFRRFPQYGHKSAHHGDRSYLRMAEDEPAA